MVSTISCVEQVLIAADEDGQYLNNSLYTAARGFELRGREVLAMTADEIWEREARPETLVFAGVPVVRHHLEALGCDPGELDYPSLLRPFLGRHFEIETLAAVRARYNDEGPKVFVKPVQQKLFTGHVVSRYRDLIPTASLPPETLVYVVGYVEWVSEWRFYIEDGEVVGVGHYNGDPLQFPKRTVVRDAVETFCDYEDGPCCYGLDMGITKDGGTQLVEMNDMFALGSYGLKPMLYSHMIEKRWNQMVANAVASAI